MNKYTKLSCLLIGRLNIVQFQFFSNDVWIQCDPDHNSTRYF